MDSAAGIRLSICIATFRRAKFIGETLQSITGQLQPGVEVVVVDGASPDETTEVVARAAAACPAVRYHREATNSGLDADYDKAVGYACGRYCWLMSDDDLLLPGAVAAVLAAIAEDPELVVVNAESRTADLGAVVDARLLPHTADRIFTEGEAEAFFVETANALSYIGAVVIRRATWLARDRASYDGSLFSHVGVIFQAPLSRVRIVAEPLVRIRWGNAMWTPRRFEIWMFKWPSLIWSFGAYPEWARAAVCPREPWRNPRMLGLHRALGSYSFEQYRSWLAGRGDWRSRLAGRAIAAVPTSVASMLASIYCLLVTPRARRELYDLAHGQHSTWIARWAARRSGL